jgi:hypothetical protein
MEEQTLSRFKLFGAWNDDKEEAWLSEMAQKGWHLQSFGFPGMYHFTAGEPREDIYRLDFISNHKDYESYLQLFHDAGWEHIGRMGGWQYFKQRKVAGKVPEIYTDNASKAQKYARLLSVLIIFMPIYIIMVISPVGGDGGLYGLYFAAKLVLSLFLLFYVYAILRIIRRIDQLRKDKKS